MIRSVLLVLILIVSTSCEREIRRSPANATSLSRIEKAQFDALSKLNPYNVKQGQLVHKIETQEVVSIGGTGKVLSKEWTTEVTKLEDQEDTRYLTTLKTVNDKVLDKNFNYEFQNVYSLELSTTLELMDQLNGNYYSPQSLIRQFEENDKSADVEVEGVAFQNLSTTEAVLVPPELVKSANNCKGLKDCRIRADIITYDIVFLLSDNSTQRHKVEWHISADVPFFAGIMKQCAATVLPVDNQRVLVKQCREVVDFDY